MTRLVSCPCGVTGRPCQRLRGGLQLAPDPLVGPSVPAAEPSAPSMVDHTRSDHLLAASGLEWTTLRPMLLDDAPSALRARVMRPGGSPLSKVSRESLARLVMAVLGDPSTQGHAVAVVMGNTQVSPATRSRA